MYREAGYTKEDWSWVHANALKARKDNKLDRLQAALLTYPKDMCDILKALDDAAPIVKKLDQPGKHFVDDFLKSEVMNLKGIHLVQRGKKYTIEYVTLKELLWAKADKHGVFGAYSEKTLIFNGKAWMGKTEFCNALAREFALRKNKTAYGWGTIDKYGAVTRAAQMHLLGCFVFDDFVLATRGGTHKLSMEEVKHLLYTKQRGTVHAFYGDAIFPEGILVGEGEQKKDGIWGGHI